MGYLLILTVQILTVRAQMRMDISLAPVLGCSCNAPATTLMARVSKLVHRKQSDPQHAIPKKKASRRLVRQGAALSG